MSLTTTGATKKISLGPNNFNPDQHAASQQSDEVQALRSVAQASDFGIVGSILAGAPALNLIGNLNTDLSGDQKRLVETYRTIIEIAFRPKLSIIESQIKGHYGIERTTNLPPEPKVFYEKEYLKWGENEKRVKEFLANLPTEVNEIISMLGISANEFKELLKEPIIDKFEIDEKAHIPPEVLVRASKLGVFKMRYPKEHGGFDFTPMMYAPIIAELMNVSESLGIVASVQNTLVFNLVLKYASKPQMDYLMPKISAGETVAFGLTEPQSGTDAIRGMQEKAIKGKDGRWEVNGRKIYITGAPFASYLLLMAKVEINGKLKPTVFIVEMPFRITDTPSDRDKKILQLKEQGLEVYPLDLALVRGSKQAYMVFGDKNKNYALPEMPINPVLGEKEGCGTEMIVGGLKSGRAGFGPICTRLASDGEEDLILYLATRNAFPRYGGTLINLPIIRSHIANNETQIALAKAVSDYTIAYIDQYGGTADCTAEAALVKVLASEMNQDVSQRAKTLKGGSGNVYGDHTELWARNAPVWVIGEGTDDVLKQLAVGIELQKLEKDGMMVLDYIEQNGLTPFKDFVFGNSKRSRISSLWQGIKNIFGSRRISPNKKQVGFWRDVIPAIGRFKSRLFDFQTGILSFGQALWIELQSKRLAVKTALLGVKYGEALELEQRRIIRIYEVAQGIYSIAIAQTRLAKPGISEKEKLTLEKAIIEQKRIVREKLNRITLKDREEDALDDRIVDLAVQDLK